MSITFRPAVRRLRTAECTPRPCAICGEVFTPVRRSKGLYCSRLCSQAGIARSTIRQRADALRGRGEGRTYRKRLGRHEHRVVAEETLGRALLPGEIVHHIDGNKLNNDPANLEVMTQGDHLRRHRIWEARWAK